MIKAFPKIEKVSGTIYFPGDKSISHRALLISSLADGKSIINNLPESEDVKSTLSCLENLGIKTEKSGKDFVVYGRGFKGYKPSLKQLYAGNSGTTARLLTGILSVQNFDSIIEGDLSLSSRPMKRLIDPLLQMNCRLKSNDGKLPVHICPSDNLKPISYILPVPSAQVKSAILFAGLHLEEETSVTELIRTRNHTENLLGLKVLNNKGKIISISSMKYYPEAKEYFIPGDISSAMFFIVLTLLTKNSELIIKNVCLNPSRIEAVNLLKKMGAKIQMDLKGESNNEAFGDLLVKSSQLSNIKIKPEIIPLIIDEIPVLSIAGIFAEGDFEINNATELRNKESDRIKSLCSNLQKTGMTVEESEDGFRISGEIKYADVIFSSFGDHRIAMAFAILSSLLKYGGKVEGFEASVISNPGFLKQLQSISS